MLGGRTWRIATVALAIVSLASSIANAGERSGWVGESRKSIFQVRGWGRAPGFDSLAGAANIEWVSLTAPLGSDCTRAHGLSRKEREFWSWAYAWNAIIATGIDIPQRRQKGPVTDETIWCGTTAMVPPIAIMRARVIERFRGAGPLAFPMMIRWPYLNGQEIWTPFAPAKPQDMSGPVVLGQYSAWAMDRHRSLAFYDHASVPGIPREPTLDAPGDPTADVKVRWLVFRDAMGAVIAMTPVAYRDDELLVGLRKAGGDPKRFAPPSLTLDDFLRESRRSAMVRVTGCSRDARNSLHVAFMPLSGDPEAGLASWYKASRRPPLDWLGDYLDASGQLCKPGDTLLILGKTFAERTANPGFPRAAIIHDGNIRKTALLTGLRLTGPDEISIDRVQQLTAEGLRRLGPTAW